MRASVNDERVNIHKFADKGRVHEPIEGLSVSTEKTLALQTACLPVLSPWVITDKPVILHTDGVARPMMHPWLEGGVQAKTRTCGHTRAPSLKDLRTTLGSMR